MKVHGQCHCAYERNTKDKRRKLILLEIKKSWDIHILRYKEINQYQPHFSPPPPPQSQNNVEVSALYVPN